jgi:hypothetical protein
MPPSLNPESVQKYLKSKFGEALFSGPRAYPS